MEKETKKINYNKVNKSKELAKDIPEDVIAKNEPEKESIAETPKPVKKVIGTVNAPLNLREASNKSSKILTVMPAGARVSIDGEENGFYKVKYNEFEGFAMTQFITKK